MLRIVKFAAAVGFIVAAAGAAQAMPAAVPMTKGSMVVNEIAFGCGPGQTRNRFGRCEYRRPAPVFRRPVCPRGMHLGPNGRRCVPNRL